VSTKTLIKIWRTLMVIYKTINLLNGKQYIGKDTKNKPTYLGSGAVLKKAIQK